MSSRQTPQVTTQFNLYNIIAILLPGVTLLVLLIPLLPASVTLDPISAAVPILALGYVTGQAIHEATVRAQRLVVEDDTLGGHRALFNNRLTDTEEDGKIERLEQRFVEAYNLSLNAADSVRDYSTHRLTVSPYQSDSYNNQQSDHGTSPTENPRNSENTSSWDSDHEVIPDGQTATSSSDESDLVGDNPDDADETDGSKPSDQSADTTEALPEYNDRLDTAYTIARAEIHRSGRGRSRLFQSAYAFCRSSLGVLAIATIFYTLLLLMMWAPNGFLSTLRYPTAVGTLDRVTGPVLLLVSSLGLLIFAMYSGFNSYMRYYVEYTLADFAALIDPPTDGDFDRNSLSSDETESDNVE